MADSKIVQLLNQIKTAVYGRDVRTAIHDAIKQCYDDGSAGAIDVTARDKCTELEDKIQDANTEVNNNRKKINALVKRTNARCITKCGSIVVEIPASSNSVKVFSNSDIDEMLGVTGSSNANTAVFVSNGDGQMTLHMDGATYLNNSWYVTFSGNTVEKTMCRINYMIARDGNEDADTTVGDVEVKAQEKTVTPNTAKQTIYPDAGYDYLKKVTVKEIPYEEETNGTAGGTTVHIG